MHEIKELACFGGVDTSENQWQFLQHFSLDLAEFLSADLPLCLL